MRGVSNVQLRQLEGMSIDELISMIEDHGYSTEAMSNDEMFELAIGIFDGHADEGRDPEDLDFTLDFMQERYHGD